MPFAVVTGSNRGIGLALCAQLKSRGYAVLAACRKSSPKLDALGVEVVQGIDVSTSEGIAQLVKAVGNRPIDLLINNAGILLSNDHLGEIDVAGLHKHFEVNAVAPLLVTQALRSQLAQGSKVALITSRMGSIDDNGSGAYYGYRMSKAALNMAGKSLAVDLKAQGVSVVILHPGMVSTDMIGNQGNIEPPEAAQGLLTQIDKLTPQTTGTFWHANGTSLPW
jgi:NAD(P)-dependent dehydrogenase (short-subunit alcohol dehydrogenase family)